MPARHRLANATRLRVSSEGERSDADAGLCGSGSDGAFFSMCRFADDQFRGNPIDGFDGLSDVQIENGLNGGHAQCAKILFDSAEFTVAV